MKTKNKTVELQGRIASVMYNAVLASYEAKLLYAKANLEVYFTSPVGIGEHSDLLAEIDVHLAIIADVEGKIEALTLNFHTN